MFNKDLLKQEIKKLLESLEDIAQKHQINEKIAKAKTIEKKIEDGSFWKRETAKDEIKSIEKEREIIQIFLKSQEELQYFSQNLQFFLEDVELSVEIFEKLKEIKLRLQKIEEGVCNMERGKFLYSNAILQISAGAGGVDAQDWTEMLTNMYLKFATKRKLKAKIVDMSYGAEAGIKQAIIRVIGSGAFGILRKEKGVHRMVRLSPFNANNLRQTSFAAVEVIPEIKEQEVVISKKDLKVDTFRSSGAGGQYVNKTDSAVRITHIPTGIVVSCQSERSQLQNKEEAYKILLGKLYILQVEQKKEKEKVMRGVLKKAEWGSQIRSYVFHPYKMVKDHHSKKKSSQVERVLEGNLELIW